MESEVKALIEAAYVVVQVLVCRPGNAAQAYQYHHCVYGGKYGHCVLAGKTKMCLVFVQHQHIIIAAFVPTLAVYVVGMVRKCSIVRVEGGNKEETIVFQ